MIWHQRALPLWASGQSTQAPCAVEHDVLGGCGSNLSPSASAYQRIISNNTYAHYEQEDNPGQKRGFNGVLYKLISSINVLTALAWLK